MDTSKEYIKMCEKAVEMQEKWEIDAGDCVKIKKGTYCIGEPADFGSEYFEGDICYIDEQTLDYCEDNRFVKFIWLPRQDQLQEMLKDRFTFRNAKSWQLNLMQRGFIPYLKENHGQSFNFGSLEQMWVKFVMYNKYNKIWDGEEWISNTEVELVKEKQYTDE